MSQRDRAIKQHLDLYMDEQRRLHREVMAASVDAKVASAQAKDAADGMAKAAADLGKWTLSIQKRVERLERIAFAAGAVYAVLSGKIQKALGIST